MALTETLITLTTQQQMLENIRGKIQEFPLSATTRGQLDRAHMEYSSILSNVINELKSGIASSPPAYSEVPPGGSTPVTGQAGQTQQKQQPKVFCVYCKATDHWSDSCAKFKTVEERKAILAGENRCFICTFPGHDKKSCVVTKPCFHCKTTKCHHTSLCKMHVPSGKTGDKAKKEAKNAKAAPKKAEKTAKNTAPATSNKSENQSTTNKNKKKPSSAQAQPTTAQAQSGTQVTINLDMAQFIAATQMKK